jgi:hypothetical protein
MGISEGRDETVDMMTSSGLYLSKVFFTISRPGHWPVIMDKVSEQLLI